jgi:GWxTD domain-containing protein
MGTILRFKNFLICLILSTASVFLAQPQAYFRAGLFNTPANEPYLETYLTVNGKTLNTMKQGPGYRNSVEVFVRILKDSVPVKVNKYNLNGPVFTDINKPPSFIDNQRYALKEGQYVVEITLTDKLNKTSNEFMIRHELTVDFNEKEIDCSSIQPLESYSQAAFPGPLTKSGFNLVPYTVNYYPESVSLLSFYIETYNTETVLGEKKPFVYSYYLESAADGKMLENYGSFKKQTSAPVSALLAKMDINNLPTGDYNLVVDVKDGENKLHKRARYYFKRVNGRLDIARRTSSSGRELEAEYFGHVDNLDTLRMFVECLWPIADGLDKERIVNQSLRSDRQLMKQFVIDFWQRRAADTTDPVKLWAKYYQNVQEVMANFKCGKQKGYYTDRGRVFLQYGAPNQRSMQPNEHNTFPYEIWQYYRISDASNGQFFTNRKFVFVNKNMGDDCYMLVHSDMVGEIRNQQWQFELTRRNNQGISNPDNSTPAGTEHNQFNDFYSNPR